MSKFKVDNDKVKEAVDSLKTLLDKCEEAYQKKMPESDVDKGSTHNELNELCKNMKTTFKYLGELINNTILFLGESSDMFDTSDRNSANAISTSSGMTSAGGGASESGYGSSFRNGNSK